MAGKTASDLERTAKSYHTWKLTLRLILNLVDFTLISLRDWVGEINGRTVDQWQQLENGTHEFI